MVTISSVIFTLPLHCVILMVPDAATQPEAGPRPAFLSTHGQTGIHHPTGGQGRGDLGVPLTTDVLECHAQERWAQVLHIYM